MTNTERTIKILEQVLKDLKTCSDDETEFLDSINEGDWRFNAGIVIAHLLPFGCVEGFMWNWRNIDPKEINPREVD